MPLAFDTLSHGEIPIGFFNVDTDIFLINDYFIFATELCSALIQWTKATDDLTMDLGFYIFKDNDDIGNLMGAINGITFDGFIGELYKLYPFPEKPGDFKQKTEGYKNRNNVEELINKYAKLEKIEVVISKENCTISIGDYTFNPLQFHEVLAYLWRGGMPKWKDGKKPDYIEEMMKAVISSDHWLFKPDEEMCQ